jgi:hypothetical protein
MWRGESGWRQQKFAFFKPTFYPFEPTTRVGRLGAFSPLGRLFSLGSFSKIAEVAQIFGLPLFLGKGHSLISTKNGFDSILGDFFTNSSGHPATNVHDPILGKE